MIIIILYKKKLAFSLDNCRQLLYFELLTILGIKKTRCFGTATGFANLFGLFALWLWATKSNQARNQINILITFNHLQQWRVIILHTNNGKYSKYIQINKN